MELTALLILSAIIPLKVENSHTFPIKGTEEVNTSFFLTKSPLLVQKPREAHFVHSNSSNATNVNHSIQVTPCSLAELVKLLLFTHDILTNKNKFISQKTLILVLLNMKKIILNFYIYVMILQAVGHQ